MDSDTGLERSAKREGEPLGESASHKRKKTVTWALEGELQASPTQQSEAEEGSSSGSEEQEGSGAAAPGRGAGHDPLFGELDAALLEEQEDLPALGSEPLQRAALLQRRLQGVEALQGLYQRELWGLLEELRLRHTHFAARQPAASVWKEGGGGSADPLVPAAAQPAPKQRHANNASPQQQQQQPVANGSPDEAGDAPPEPCTVRQLWERSRAAQLPGGQQQLKRQHGRSTRASEAFEAAAAAAATAAAAVEEWGDVSLFAEVEALLLGSGPPPAAAAEPSSDSPAAADVPPGTVQQLQEQRRGFGRRLALAGRLEQAALAAACREMDARGAVAVLCGRRGRYLLRKAGAVLGRSTQSGGKVDVDLSPEPLAHTVSRQQAQLFLGRDGQFALRATGRRAVHVNGQLLAAGRTAPLPHLSLVRAGGVSLLFLVNRAAVGRLLARSAALSV